VLVGAQLMSRIWLDPRKQSQTSRGGAKGNISIEGMPALYFLSHQLISSLLALKTVINKLTDKKRSAALIH
jgi:hypothetical protein